VSVNLNETQNFSLKTCLRYPGGKSKATQTLAPWYPENFKEYREPFIGGGSVAFYTTQAYPDVPIWINDLYVPLILLMTLRIISMGEKDQCTKDLITISLLPIVF
jgi:site-specific DNA-adenine methylase